VQVTPEIIQAPDEIRGVPHSSLPRRVRLSVSLLSGLAARLPLRIRDQEAGGNVKGTKPVKKAPESVFREFVRARQATAYQIDFSNYEPEGREFDSLRARHSLSDSPRCASATDKPRANFG